MNNNIQKIAVASSGRSSSFSTFQHFPFEQILDLVIKYNVKMLFHITANSDTFNLKGLLKIVNQL